MKRLNCWVCTLVTMLVVTMFSFAVVPTAALANTPTATAVESPAMQSVSGKISSVTVSAPTRVEASPELMRKVVMRQSVRADWIWSQYVAMGKEYRKTHSWPEFKQEACQRSGISPCTDTKLARLPANTALMIPLEEVYVYTPPNTTVPEAIAVVPSQNAFVLAPTVQPVVTANERVLQKQVAALHAEVVALSQFKRDAIFYATLAGILLFVVVLWALFVPSLRSQTETSGNEDERVAPTLGCGTGNKCCCGPSEDPPDRTTS